jgi:hypothetical protein
MYDSGSDKFLTRDRYNALLQPIVNVLDRADSPLYDKIIQVLIPCLATFAVGIANEVCIPNNA